MAAPDDFVIFVRRATGGRSLDPISVVPHGVVGPAVWVHLHTTRACCRTGTIARGGGSGIKGRGIKKSKVLRYCPVFRR